MISFSSTLGRVAAVLQGPAYATAELDLCDFRKRQNFGNLARALRTVQSLPAWLSFQNVTAPTGAGKSKTLATELIML